ncbi:potassium channel family protein [Actinacidiphila sp. bgisy167]|uniref:potassium channel family protein n=1 Tax=Actinacidiphila sp. bgisy167 TaxID=3413797 RepID=UPI003D747C02
MTVPAVVSRVLQALFVRGGRSLHFQAVGWATLVLLAAMLMGSYAVVAVERGAPSANLTTYPRALWWSAETATTVGYGDFYPVTPWGRVVACALMFVGITTYGMVTAALATWFVGREQQRQRRLARALRDEAARGERWAGEEAELLHARFDRLERLIAAGGGGTHREGGPADA